ncbi:MAG: hypothetical protein KF687_02030 [Cyclobacteriaceae bacterium]|nr:hypothetical protein [Cyclobacteriaceae bacterium]
MRFVIFLIITLSPLIAFSQDLPVSDVDSLKREILLLRADVDQIQLNLATSQKKFKTGIIIATIGYSVTIAGGLMLGRKYDDLGKVLLVTGGATGITGTFLMTDAFKYLNRKPKRPVATRSATN